MNTTTFFLLNKNRMKSVYNVPLVRTQSTTALANIGQLLDVQITGVQNNDILVYNSPKWVNRPQVLNNNSDVTITAPAVNEFLGHNGTEWVNREIAINELSDVTINAPVNNNYLGHNGTEWINKEIALNDLSDVALTSLSVNQILQWDGDYWSNYTLPAPDAFANLSDVQITSVQNNDSVIFNTSSGKYINKKKYAEYDNIVQLSNQTITAVARTIYFCNLATINLPASTIGECIKIINALGPVCTFAYTGIIYHLVNNFNTSYTTTDSAEIELEGILGGNWQIKSFTGRWNNNSTNRRLVNNNLEDLLNTNIVLPVSNNYLRFNGTNWVNANLPNYKIFLTSAGNLSNNQYIGNFGQNANYLSTINVAPHNITIVAITVFISVNTTTGTRTFTLFKNQVTTGVQVIFTNLTGLFSRVTCNINYVLGDTFSIFNASAGAPNASGCVCIEYI